MNSLLFGFLPNIGFPEMMIIGAIAVLLFGNRLPEVARSMGKSLVEFKKGMRGIEDQVNSSVYSTPSRSSINSSDDYEEATAPKFEPPTSEPKVEASADAANSEAKSV
jgi:sec-independent protein translocase protein TatA